MSANELPRSRALTIHAYVLLWNEEFLVPYFLRHYAGICAKIIALDNHSTDRSCELLLARPEVKIHKWKADGDSVCLHASALKSQIWKESRGKADWVFVLDMDEFVFHPDLESEIQRLHSEGCTIVRPTGYAMVSEIRPDADGELWKLVKRGARDSTYDKACLFRPDCIDEIDYNPGCHIAKPTGSVRFPDKNMLKLLHFRYLGREATWKRFQTLAAKLLPGDSTRKFGYQYLQSREEFDKEFDKIRMSATDITP